MRTLEDPECDGHTYEHGVEYDLSEGDMFFYQTKFSALMEMFETADEVRIEDESGHREFVWATMPVSCNFEEVSRSTRRLFWTIETPDSEA
jgi:hypothetical protein